MQCQLIEMNVPAVPLVGSVFLLGGVSPATGGC